MIIPNVVVLEYSISQDCFHIQTLKESLEDNLMNSFAKCNSDYVIIGVFENELDAHRFSETVRNTMITQAKKDIDALINKTLFGG